MIAEFFEKRRWMQLIFALICGAAYFFIAYGFIEAGTANGGGFLAFLFCPAIICGMALIIIKSMRRFFEEENTKAVNFLVFAHMVIIVAGIFSAIERFVF